MLFHPQCLTNEIIHVLRLELFSWIRDGVFSTHADFVRQLIYFANCSLHISHPEQFLRGCMIEDPEMEVFLGELTEFVNDGGFRGRLKNINFIKNFN